MNSTATTLTACGLVCRAASPCDGLDDMVLVLQVNEDLESLLAKAEKSFQTASGEGLEPYKLEVWDLPQVYAVAQEHWSQLLEAVSAQCLDGKGPEEVYDLEGWEFVRLPLGLRLREARTEAWSTVITKQGVYFHFSGKHEDQFRTSPRLDFTEGAKHCATARRGGPNG